MVDSVMAILGWRSSSLWRFINAREEGESPESELEAVSSAATSWLTSGVTLSSVAFPLDAMLSNLRPDEHYVVFYAGEETGGRR